MSQTSFRSSDNHSNARFISNSKDSAPLEPGKRANFTRVLAANSITDTSFDGSKFLKLLEYLEILVVVFTTSPLIRQSIITNIQDQLLYSSDSGKANYLLLELLLSFHMHLGWRPCQRYDD